MARRPIADRAEDERKRRRWLARRGVTGQGLLPSGLAGLVADMRADGLYHIRVPAVHIKKNILLLLEIDPESWPIYVGAHAAVYDGPVAFRCCYCGKRLVSRHDIPSHEAQCPFKDTIVEIRARAKRKFSQRQREGRR